MLETIRNILSAAGVVAIPAAAIAIVGAYSYASHRVQQLTEEQKARIPGWVKGAMKFLRMETEPKNYRLEKAYKLLGIDKGSTDEEVKQAYRRQAKLHHPDKYAGRTVHERKQAEIRMGKFNEAFQDIKNSRPGFH